MSIICYTGLPGHGKSYSAVENGIIAALRDGRHVAHNLELNIPALNVVCERNVEPLLHPISRDATPTEFIAACPPGAVIVIDEVWRYWAAGVKANEVPKEELKFFKEHRHRVGEDGLATEILIIDQDPKTGIPAFLRALVELTYVHEKHSKIGASGRFRVDVYNRCQSAEKPAKSALIRKLQGRYRPEVWNCYTSHTQSKKIGEAGLERMTDDRANLLKSWTVRAAFVSVVLLPFIAWAAIGAVVDMSTGGGLKEESAFVAKATAAPQARKPDTVKAAMAAHRVAPTPTPAPNHDRAPHNPSAVHSAPPSPTPPPISGAWRVVGGATRSDGSGVVLLVSAAGPRRIDAAECELDERTEWRCQVEDGIATYYSGARSSSPMSASVAPGVGQNSPPISGTPAARAGG